MKKSIIYTIFCVVFMMFSMNMSNAQDADTSIEETLEEFAEQEASYTETVLHHIDDANEFHIVGNVTIPLPVILYNYKEGGFSFFMSSAFNQGEKVVDGYVLQDSKVKFILDGPVDGHVDKTYRNDKDENFAVIDGTTYELQEAANLLNLSTASFIDFSITMNVLTMILAAILLILIFTTVRKGYEKNDGRAPSGLQSFMEPFIIFIRDEVAKPAIGDGWEKFFPFIAMLFFFILICNILGMIPFFPGGANVMGNVGVTLALAFIVFIVTSFSGNKSYWQHIFWMPGVPVAVKPILAIIEFLGMFTKPFTLFIRLFANITAGHIIVLSLIGLIFIMGQNGASIGGAIGGGVIGVPFVFAINFLEIFVGALQAFIFALLAALYIGDAIAE